MADHVQKTYFYAGEDAEIYDLLAPLTDPVYLTVHDFLPELIQKWRQAEAPALPEGASFRIADVGCGTGEEAIRLLRQFPDTELLCIDSSPEMIDLLQAKLKRELGDRCAAGRCHAVARDIRDSGWLSSAVRDVWGYTAVGRLDAVVSVYTLHHFEPDQKRVIYGEIFAALKQGGGFANVDLFAFATPWLSAFVQKIEEDTLMRRLSDPGEAVFLNNPGLMAEIERVRDQWLHHLQTENRPLPMSRTGFANTLPKAAVEEELLSAAGFGTVECVFRHFQSGIMWAEK